MTQSTKLVCVQYEARGGNEWVDEGLKQIRKRKQKSKSDKEDTRGAKVNDRKLVKNLQAKEGCEKVELVRLLCYAGWYDTPLMASQAVYRSYHEDGTVRESTGKLFFYKTKGEFSFKNRSSDDKGDGSGRSSSKIKLERDGTVIKVRNQDGKQCNVSHSMKMTYLRC